MIPSSSSLSISSSSKMKRDEASLDEPSCNRRKYDLFVNYSFEDIGKSFISHVHGALVRNGFTISDHTKLPLGQEVCSELLKAIDESEIIVVVFSIKYAFSVRCLDELVHIMNCKHKKKLFPVFFNVDPSDVRNQKGPFKEAFKAHTINFSCERVQKWRKALNDAGGLSGQPYNSNGDEESFIRKIVKKLKSMQNPQELYVPDPLVGIESRVKELISSLRLDLEDVSIVAVLGISGIGKTTIAAATFNRIAAKFDACCFLGGIYYYDSGSQTSMVKLQKLLISGLSQNNKLPMIHSQSEGVAKIRKVTSSQKVLLILDDVDNFGHLEALGIHPKFFQGGSRIIVTTRDKRSLGTLSYVPYNTSLLEEWESIELFTRLTYKQYEPIDTHLVNEIAKYSSGLPLVLEVWSRHFTLIEKREQWPNVLETLKAIPHDDVQKKLKISYESLTNRAKKLFLDIACFFDGIDKTLILEVLQDEESAFFPDIEIQRLADRGLVINHPIPLRLSMHGVIREMGQEIVRQENEDEPGQRTRLINRKDVLRVLTEFSGTQTVESISCSVKNDEKTTGHIDAFRKMKNLRLLRLHNVAICSNPRNPLGCDCEDMSPLSFPKLKYFEWKGFPMKSINIDMCNVVVVELEDSFLETLWEGSKCLKKLKILNVAESLLLTKTGDFIGLENLEVLNFSSCKNLEELDSSVWCLDKLVKLDLSWCKQLKRFPTKMELGKLRSLKELYLHGCESIGFEEDEVFKHFMSSLKETRITKLLLGYSKIRKVPSEVGSLMRLKELNLISCTCLTTLPSNMAELTSLKILNFNGCWKLGIEDPECLMKLTGLTSLTSLDMTDCNVSQVPSEIGNLVSLNNLDLSGNTFCSLPDSFGNLLQLRHLSILNCSKLTSLPLLPPALQSIDAIGCKSLDVMRSASVVIDELCGCPTPAVNMNNHPYYKFSKCVLAKYTVASFRLEIRLSNDHKKEFPMWCHNVFLSTQGEFVAPKHLHERKICGIITCIRVISINYDVVELQNKTKGTSCRLTRAFLYSLDTFSRLRALRNEPKGVMCITFYPLDNSVLMVEAGDTLAIDFQKGVTEIGVRLIYKDGACDEMEVEPTTNPFN